MPRWKIVWNRITCHTLYKVDMLLKGLNLSEAKPIRVFLGLYASESAGIATSMNMWYVTNTTK